MIVQALQILESLKCTVQFTIGSADPGSEEYSGLQGSPHYSKSELHENSASLGGCCRWFDIFEQLAVMSSSILGPILYAYAQSILPLNTSGQLWAAIASSHKQGLISVAQLIDAEAQFQS